MHEDDLGAGEAAEGPSQQAQRLLRRPPDGDMDPRVDVVAAGEMPAGTSVDEGIHGGAGGGGGGGGGGGRGGGGPAGGVGVFDGEVDSSNPRGLSGGTWAACSASSLLAAAALLW